MVRREIVTATTANPSEREMARTWHQLAQEQERSKRVPVLADAEA
jgi:hypothetical protein